MHEDIMQGPMVVMPRRGGLISAADQQACNRLLGVLQADVSQRSYAVASDIITR
jgi:hypothetical protein